MPARAARGHAEAAAGQADATGVHRTPRMGVCNAAESLLVHRDVAGLLIEVGTGGGTGGLRGAVAPTPPRPSPGCVMSLRRGKPQRGTAGLHIAASANHGTHSLHQLIQLGRRERARRPQDDRLMNGDESVRKSHARPIDATAQKIIRADGHHGRERF